MRESRSDSKANQARPGAIPAGLFFSTLHIRRIEPIEDEKPKPRGNGC